MKLERRCFAIAVLLQQNRIDPYLAAVLLKVTFKVQLQIFEEPIITELE